MFYAYYLFLWCALLSAPYLCASVANPVFFSVAGQGDFIGFLITLSGFLIEWALLYMLVKKDAARTFIITMLMNVASGIVGIGILYALDALAVVGVFPLRALLPHPVIYFVSFFVVAVGVNTIVETPVARLLSDMRTHVLMPIVLFINIVSIGFGLTAVLAYDLYQRKNMEIAQKGL